MSLMVGAISKQQPGMVVTEENNYIQVNNTILSQENLRALTAGQLNQIEHIITGGRVDDFEGCCTGGFNR